MWKFIGIILVAFSAPALAADKGLELAKESYEFLQDYEGRLNIAIRSGDPIKYNKYIFTPTLEQFRRWPKLGDERYDKYFMCRMALDAFRIWSDEQFHAGGALPKSASSALDYVDKKQQCRSALGKKLTQ